MPKGIGVDFGRCGFGFHTRPRYMVRLGIVTIIWFPDGIEAVFRSYSVALMVKRNEERGE
ncbi:hypothetical protein ACLEIY_16025 [Acetobacter tropicalis]|uniref:hypothetical protein n=1 Tax=Acetobacter TaxID=434 RepID=UPI0011231E42|nr:hypothetical protein [Acetobacter senegalensis]MCG4258180.1 hypothetical protein [Acetobacter senegalensis]MCG4268107.1 hypothetical protein [Acetobacter senegalensis]